MEKRSAFRRENVNLDAPYLIQNYWHDLRTYKKVLGSLPHSGGSVMLVNAYHFTVATIWWKCSIIESPPSIAIYYVRNYFCFRQSHIVIHANISNRMLLFIFLQKPRITFRRKWGHSAPAIAISGPERDFRSLGYLSASCLCKFQAVTVCR